MWSVNHVKILKKLIWKEKERAPVPVQAYGAVENNELKQTWSCLARALPVNEKWDFACLCNTVYGNVRQHRKYSIFLPAMKSLSWLPHVFLTRHSENNLWICSPFETLSEEMPSNLLTIPNVFESKTKCLEVGCPLSVRDNLYSTIILFLTSFFPPFLLPFFPFFSLFSLPFFTLD